jgi:hypothetical protein
MKKRSILAVALALTLGAVLSRAGQAMPEAGHKARITVGPNVQVSEARAALAHAEVVLAADLNHPGRLLAGSMVLNPGMGPSVVAYASQAR